MIYNGALGVFSSRYSIRMYVQFSILDLQLKTLLKHPSFSLAYISIISVHGKFDNCGGGSVIVLTGLCSSLVNWKEALTIVYKMLHGHIFFVACECYSIVFVPGNKVIITLSSH